MDGKDEYSEQKDTDYSEFIKVQNSDILINFNRQNFINNDEMFEKITDQFSSFEKEMERYEKLKKIALDGIWAKELLFNFESFLMHWLYIVFFFFVNRQYNRKLYHYKNHVFTKIICSKLLLIISLQAFKLFENFYLNYIFL